MAVIMKWIVTNYVPEGCVGVVLSTETGRMATQLFILCVPKKC